MAEQKKPTYYEVRKFESINEMIKMAADESGAEIAFKYKQSNDFICSVTYSEFFYTTSSLGAALEDKGFTAAHIGCIGENSYNWLTAYITVLRSAGVFVPVDKELPVDDIINIVNQSDTEFMFCDSSFEKMFRENISAFPKVKYFAVFGREDDDGIFLSYKKFLANGSTLYSVKKKPFPSLRNDISALKLLVYTSGTTGMAKGVMLSERNIVSCVYYGLQVSTVYDCCLSVLPYHHTYEAVCGILVSLHMRATICINDNLRSIMRNFKLFKPSYIYLVPTFAELFYKRIWNVAAQSGKEATLKKAISVSNSIRKIGMDKRKAFFVDIHDTFGGRLRKIVCGGAPLRPETARFFDSIGISLINGYGITECSPLVAANREEANDFDSAGIPLPCLELKIDNPTEDGIGEICVKGDTVMLGYYKNESATADAIRDGWFYTGDYGLINEKGNLVITGRKKNLIVLQNGKNVYPEEVEFALESSPIIKETMVYGAKDETGAVSVKAVIIPDFDIVNPMLAEKNISPDDRGYNDAIKRMFVEEVKKINAKAPSFKMIKHFTLRKADFDKTSSKKIKRYSELNKSHEDDINC